MQDPFLKPAQRIALAYVVFAGLWIFFSDSLVNTLIRDPDWQNRLQTVKGSAFVLVTGALLYWLMLISLKRIRSVALEDPLTTLPNRYAFESELARLCRRGLQRDLSFHLTMIDIDHFKDLNDELGHNQGDDLLLLLCRSLRDHLGPDWYIARLGGDEFGLISPPTLSTLEVRERLDWLQHSLTRSADQPLLNNQTLSMGTSGFLDDGRNNRDLMRHADMALYHAKRQGRDQHCVFREELRERLMAKLALTKDLRQACEGGEFELVYQPQWSVSHQRWVGAEVLIRWPHPERGYISPAEFIPLAEEQGLISRITAFVLDRAFGELRAAGLTEAGLPRLSVNLSHLALLDPAAMEHLRKLALAQPADGPRLLLEITESATMESLEQTLAAMSHWQREGIQFSIDDFGTGYSSLSMLKQLPLAELKVDRSFIQDIPGDRNDAIITQTILAMARTLSLAVVAEGVETAEQADFLTANGCTTMQGFYYARPMSIDKLTDLLKQ